VAQLPLDNADAMALIKTYVDKSDEVTRLLNERNESGDDLRQGALKHAMAKSAHASLAARELREEYGIDVDELMEAYREHAVLQDELADVEAQRVEDNTETGYF
jgi:8-oxo-dGTP pyrophosphatase MutT (NUDIX family)